MSFFDKLEQDSTSAKKSLMGPDYSYVKNINGTSKLNIGEKWDDIGNNISGLTSYIQVLVEGGGRASKTGKPLGNKFFLKSTNTIANSPSNF